jgi:hypothetical protein
MSEIEAIRARVESAGVLATAIRIGLVESPTWMVVEVVIQDEFTHDVVMAAEGSAETLVLDCT